LKTLFARINPAARRDVDEYVLWLRNEAGPDTASRFAKAAIDTFDKLAQTPAMGQSVPSSAPYLTTLRKWKVDGFPKLLIFYRPSAEGIEVVRVFHGAQDWWQALDIASDNA
jgi:toxin ParE1/3/4